MSSKKFKFTPVQIESSSWMEGDIERVTLHACHGSRKSIARVTLSKVVEPDKIYYVHFISVDREFQNHRISSQMIEAVNQLLERNNASGILQDSIFERNQSSPRLGKLMGLYGRHGWRPVLGTRNYMSYNLSSTFIPSDIGLIFNEIDENQFN